MKEFLDIVFQKLSEMEESRIIKDIRTSLTEFNISVDFESVYEILQGLCDPIVGVKNAGPFAA
jgi:hypothetical protein